jgi:aminoglycoside phosphotransferase (APT) family kinase protein
VALDLREARGRKLRAVLKLYRPDESEPDFARREAKILPPLAATDMPAPKVVAIDHDGDDTGWPVWLMTRLPGWRRIKPHAQGAGKVKVQSDETTAVREVAV